MAGTCSMDSMYRPGVRQDGKWHRDGVGAVGGHLEWSVAVVAVCQGMQVLWVGPMVQLSIMTIIDIVLWSIN